MYDQGRKMYEWILNVLLHKRSQSEKAMYYMILIICHSWKGKTEEAAKRPVIGKDLRWGEGGLNSWSSVYFLGQWNYFESYSYDQDIMHLQNPQNFAAQRVNLDVHLF